MEVVWLTLTGIVLYVVSDRILDAMERRAGRRFEQRSLIFFGLILGLALITFAIIRNLFHGG
ncbi:MAG TPA: hypothetical protein VK052_06195 [Zeimonas sp.]|nr:hypothetical protein [Zeimonas sp.]